MANDLPRCRTERIKFIQLIMSDKSKQDMQLETMRYMMENKYLLKEYLQAGSEKEDDQAIFHHISSSIPVSSVPSNSVKYNNNYGTNYHNENEKRNHGLLNPTAQKENGSKQNNPADVFKKVIFKPRRKRRSKYVDVDFSHIYREPKTSKYRTETNESTTAIIDHLDSVQHTCIPRNENSTVSNINVPAKTTSKCDINVSDTHLYSKIRGFDKECDFDKDDFTDRTIQCGVRKEASECLKRPVIEATGVENQNHLANNDTGTLNKISDRHDHKFSPVRHLLVKLINSKSRREQDNVLKIIRSDEILQKSFLREANSLRNVKIPLFHNPISITKDHGVNPDGKEEFDRGDVYEYQRNNQALEQNFARKRKIVFDKSSTTNQSVAEANSDNKEETLDIVQHIDCSHTSPLFSLESYSATLHDASISDATEYLDIEGKIGLFESIHSKSNRQIRSEALFGISNHENISTNRQTTKHLNNMSYPYAFDNIDAIN